MFKIITLISFFSSYSVQSYSQYNREIDLNKFTGHCFKTTKIKSYPNHINLYCSDTCRDEYFNFSLLVIDSNKYFRDGMSIWYYDARATKIKASIFFVKSNIYGYVTEYYPNSKIKYEGLCKTIKYFHPNGNKYIYKIDQMDTTLINFKGVTTYDSIKYLNKYSFLDTITGEGYSETNELLFYSPYYQKQKFGEWKYYDDTGKLIKEEFYEKGKLIKTENK